MRYGGLVDQIEREYGEWNNKELSIDVRLVESVWIVDVEIAVIEYKCIERVEYIEHEIEAIDGRGENGAMEYSE